MEQVDAESVKVEQVLKADDGKVDVHTALEEPDNKVKQDLDGRQDCKPACEDTTSECKISTDVSNVQDSTVAEAEKCRGETLEEQKSSNLEGRTTDSEVSNQEAENTQWPQHNVKLENSLEIESNLDEVATTESSENLSQSEAKETAGTPDSVEKDGDVKETSEQSHRSSGSLCEQSERKEEAVCEPRMETDKNDNNQNSSVVTETDLRKLVDGNSEVVVLTVETITDEATGENIVVTVDEKNVALSSSESALTSVHSNSGKTSDHGKTEFNLLPYGQESEGTIIEVISTEVVESEATEETYIQQGNKNDAKEDSKRNPDVTVNAIQSENSEEKTVDSDNNVKNDTLKENVSYNEDEVMTENNNETKTEMCDSLAKRSSPRIDVVHVTIPTCTENSVSEVTSTPATSTPEKAVKKRSLLLEILDDWSNKNTDEDNYHSPTKVQDSVEIELKTLLDGGRTPQTVTQNIMEEKISSAREQSTANESHKSVQHTDPTDLRKTPSTEAENKTKGKPNQTSSLMKKDQLNYPLSQNLGRSPKPPIQNSTAFSQSSQLQYTPVKNRGRHLTSQIASPAEVTEVLKERLREKQQKIVEPPRGPDIFFVKKITQRLSSKLAGGPVTAVPPLIPLSQSIDTNQKTESINQKSTTTDASKDGTSDKKELLAILEGDVDPDWSNLKPPTLLEEGKNSTNEQTEHSGPPKLDPVMERELALKQLLELPMTSMKKGSSKKKKPPPAKVPKETETKPVIAVSDGKKEVVNVDLSAEETETADSKTEKAVEKTDEQPAESHQNSASGKETTLEEQDVRVEESRSGRKRKPTEKAREHEQSATKRQKLSKGKVPVQKKQTQSSEITTDTDSATEATSRDEVHATTDSNSSADVTTAEANTVSTSEVPSEPVESKIDVILSKPENSPLKRPKQSLAKKGSQPIGKRKMVVKKLLRQKMSPTKKTVNLKSKLTTQTKKTSSKIVAKTPKRHSEASSGDSKPKKKIINEIDRLLQDEGVVNLLYDVEQPDKKRLIPITKSQAKVMDIQKVQRELKIRKKLVRNAVLRLRTSTGGVTKVSPRSKRTAHLGDSHLDKKLSEQVTSLKQANAPSSDEFIFPAKIRNAADASIIIRRHSSSSFSSASGSPRVSIDGPEKSPEAAKTDEGGTHILRSAKRRFSQEEKINAKKSKKKVQKVESEIAEEEKTVVRPAKKPEPKKAEKAPKQTETVAPEENISKVITRSNGAATSKVTTKSKKPAKSKVTFAKVSELESNEDSSKDDDELSVCLAEAATALAVVNASRSGNAAANRKNKANANVAKSVDVDSNKTKVDANSQFINKEINVRRHGNLVQLILTPSSPTKLKNALTLQLMQEFRETLSILRNDDDCRVVLLTSTGTSFCEGLELSSLLHANKEDRRLLAEELAENVKDFIKSLATFNKPLVAGVQGAAVGLGVTMLPLFDLVIASDKATFSTPYGKLGQIAEGAAIFTLSHILGSAITSELLLSGRTLTASEALRAGLVTRVLWPDRFQVELLPSLRAMSEQSAQSMEATKALLRHSLRKKLDAALESETYLLIQHWCSAECQTAIKAYMDGKVE